MYLYNYDLLLGKWGREMTTQEVLTEYRKTVDGLTELRIAVNAIKGQLARRQGTEAWRVAAQSALEAKRRRIVEARSEQRLLARLLLTKDIED